MHYKTELERLSNVHSDTAATAEELDAHKRSLRDEIKQLKLREREMVNDYAELEEENISLQKQVITCVKRDRRSIFFNLWICG